MRWALELAVVSTAVAAAGAVPLAMAMALDAAVRARAVALLASPIAGPLPRGARQQPSTSPLAAGWAAPRLARAAAARLTRGRERRRRAEALPAVLSALAQQLRSGRSLHQAVVAVAAKAPPALAGELDGVVQRARHGAGLVDGLRWWAAIRGDEEVVRLVAASLAVAVETGGPAARVVDVAAEIVRDRHALAGEVGALTAQARVSALVIAVAPLAMAAIAAVSDPSTARFLLTTAPGLAMLACGLALDATGIAWMALLLRRYR